MDTPQKIPWSDSLSTGARAVDIQHKFLIELINHLAEAITEGKGKTTIGKILLEIKYYTEWHFAREELFMDRYKCPAAEVNKRAHAGFIQTFESFQREFKETGGSDELARRAYTELTNWLVNHIMKVDKQLYNYAINDSSEAVG